MFTIPFFLFNQRFKDIQIFVKLVVLTMTRYSGIKKITGKMVRYGGFCLYLLLVTILKEVSHCGAKKIKNYLIHKSLQSCFLGNSECDVGHGE